MEKQKVVILDFGGQYKELIARRVRECGVYSLIKPYNTSIKELREISPIGIIFTGGPNSVYLKESPKCDPAIFEMGIPILGICYGMQLIAHMLGGKISACEKSEYGRITASVNTESALFSNIVETQNVLMSHTDKVIELPSGNFRGIANTKLCEIAAFECPEQKIYGVQFHPEVEISENGTQIIRNFLYNICKADGDYSIDDYLNQQIEKVKDRVGNKRVLLGLSGGVDSSVCAALLSKAIPGQLICIYIDHGFMRKGETEQIKQVFENVISVSYMSTQKNDF